jgi:hypothetical protein
MGTVSAELRRKVLQNFASYVIGLGPGFGKRVGDRIEVTELVCCLQRLEAMAVCEIVVKEGMVLVLWTRPMISTLTKSRWKTCSTSQEAHCMPAVLPI